MAPALRVLVTNDDGVDAPGLHALAADIAELGHDVVVVAPSADMSGAGASIGRMASAQDLDAVPVKLPGAEHVPAWSLPGPPGMCVLAARLGALGDPPDLVVSGINPGCNTGRSVLHSGTVGAALTAANFGSKGLAVSIDVPAAALMTAGAHPRWATAAAFAAQAVAWLAAAPAGTVLNLNVPDLPAAGVRGVRWATLAPFGTVRTAVVQPLGAEGGRLQLELRPHDEQLPAGSDTALIREGYATVTLLTGIRATDPVDPFDPADIFGPLAGNGHDGGGRGRGDGDPAGGPDGGAPFAIEARPVPAGADDEPATPVPDAADRVVHVAAEVLAAATPTPADGDADPTAAAVLPVGDTTPAGAGAATGAGHPVDGDADDGDDAGASTAVEAADGDDGDGGGASGAGGDP
jgi:5'-nucleotidase